MKKLSLVIAALAMMLGITQCKKQENPVGGKLITQEVTFTTSFGDGSKLGVTEIGGTLDLLWQVYNKITVTDNAAEPNESTLECTSVSNNGLTGTFEGTITCIEDAQLTFSVGTEPDYMNQHFTSINESIIYLVGKSDFEQSGSYEVDMALPYAILKVDLAKFAPESGSTDVSVKIGDATEPVAVVTGVKTDDYRFYLLLPLTVTEPTETTLTFTAGDKTITRTYTLASHGFYTHGGNGGYAPIMKDYFCFTAKESGAQVHLLERTSEEPEPGEKMNEVYFKPELEYSSNGSNWQDFSLGQTILLNDVGSKVYFRRKAEAGTSSTFSISPDYYMYFAINDNIAASGNIMSLLDPNCESTEIPCNYCFCKLFSGCTTLTDASELILPAIDLKEGCYSHMFEGCESLEIAPELPATTLAESCYNGMFSGCSKLKYIKVHFTSWASNVNATSGWVSDVSSGGTFYCPSGCSEDGYYETFNNNRIPKSPDDKWTVEKF